MSIPCKVCQKFDSASKRCSKCKSEFYCSKNCQKTDWPFHKQFCNELAGYIEKWIKRRSDRGDPGYLLRSFDKKTVGKEGISIQRICRLCPLDRLRQQFQ